MDEESQTECMIRIAKKASCDAVKRAFSMGLPVTILQDGYIIKKYPNKDIEIIRKVENSSVMPKKKIWRV
jgi:hypothetical protein